MKYYIALALIAFALAPASAQQEVDCTEEFFRIVRRQDDCQAFFVCMIGGRIDFTCDDGDIFDANRVQCRPGDRDTCTFTIPQIPADECQNDFLRIGPHPDPDQCDTFFVCMNYNLVVFRCRDGEIFSERTEGCVPGNQQTCRETSMSTYERLMQSIRKH